MFRGAPRWFFLFHYSVVPQFLSVHAVHEVSVDKESVERGSGFFLKKKKLQILCRQVPKNKDERTERIGPLN